MFAEIKTPLPGPKTKKIIDRDESTPIGLSGHGIDQQKVIEEITSAGFELERRIDDWEGDTYALIFHKPTTGPSGP